MKIIYILYVLKIVFLLSIARNEQSLYFQEACPTFLVLSWKHSQTMQSFLQRFNKTLKLAYACIHNRVMYKIFHTD